MARRQHGRPLGGERGEPRQGGARDRRLGTDAVDPPGKQVVLAVSGVAEEDDAPLAIVEYERDVVGRVAGRRLILAWRG